MASVARGEWKVAPEAMVTRWGKQVTPQNVWQEYPRPQFRRDENWKNLNGLWQYAISKNGVTPLQQHFQALNVGVAADFPWQ